MAVGYRPVHGPPDAARARRTAPRRRSSSTPPAAAGRRRRPSPSSRSVANRLARALLALGAQRRRSHRVVRAQLARGHHDDPRQPQGRAHVGPGVVPVQRRRDAVRHRQLRRHRGRGRRRAGAAAVASVRDQLPKVRAVLVFGGDRARRLRPAGTTSLAQQPPRAARRRRSTRPPAATGADDDLHVGHHREARRARCAPTPTPWPSAPCSNGWTCSTSGSGAPHHRAALPLRSARVRVVRARGRRHHRRAAEVRSRRVAAPGEGAPRHRHLQRADAAEAHRRAAARRARARRPARRCAR